MDQYPTINKIVEHGDAIAPAVAVLPLLGALSAFFILGAHWLVLAAGAVGSVVLLFLMKSFVELVRVISDMLLPK
jgi:hypothetical protein